MASDKLYKMRSGTPQHKSIKLRGEDFAIVLLGSDIIRSIEEQTEEYYNRNKDRVNDAVRAQYYNALLVFNCLRDPNNLSERVADKVSDIESALDSVDMTEVVDAYRELIINKSPRIDLLTQDELDEVKKHLEVTALSDLSTVLCVHLKNCHLTIVSEK